MSEWVALVLLGVPVLAVLVVPALVFLATEVEDALSRRHAARRRSGGNAVAEENDEARSLPCPCDCDCPDMGACLDLSAW
jgi:hypothetical protein